MEIVLQTIANGILVGALYGLVALDSVLLHGSHEISQYCSWDIYHTGWIY